MHFGPLPIAGVGRFGLIADPQGAVAYVIQRDEPTPASPEEPSPGRFCWMSLSTPDVHAARAFWGAVIGYRFEQPTMDGGFAPVLAYAGDAMVADFDADNHPPGAPAM